MKEKIAQLEDFIMKNCLWQFHSRNWDRVRQNDNILLKTTQLLCDEPVDNSTPEERCYWVDAVYLVESFRKRFQWINTMEEEEIRMMMQGLKDRIDFLTIKGSLNKELTDPLY